ncbi:hypothetical protein BACI9J_60539 [Bacillus altitudinis]|nr:hypothetical protein BACI9J_60539 [Bacillus altitudinis]
MISQASLGECLYMKSLLLAYNNSGHQEELKKEAKYEKTNRIHHGKCHSHHQCRGYDA